MLKEFKQFLLRGNVIDLAVAVVIGSAFGAVVSSLVSDLLTPLIGVFGKIPEFKELDFSINGSKFMIGHFLNVLITFFFVASAIFFFVIKPVNMLVKRSTPAPAPKEPTTKKCPECLGDIPLAAKRCMHCTQIVS
jgi:large conductance mechanosensitive channel